MDQNINDQIKAEKPHPDKAHHPTHTIKGRKPNYQKERRRVALGRGLERKMVVECPWNNLERKNSVR